MRIHNGPPPIPERPARAKGEAEVDPKATGAGQATVPGEGISITSSAADRASQTLDVEVASRLDRVRELLANGDYAVDYDQLAQRVAEEEFLL